MQRPTITPGGQAPAAASARAGSPAPGPAPRSHRWLRLGAPACPASALGSACLRRCHGDAAPPPAGPAQRVPEAPPRGRPGQDGPGRGPGDRAGGGRARAGSRAAAGRLRASGRPGCWGGGGAGGRAAGARRVSRTRLGGGRAGRADGEVVWPGPGPLWVALCGSPRRHSSFGFRALPAARRRKGALGGYQREQVLSAPRRIPRTYFSALQQGVSPVHRSQN